MPVPRRRELCTSGMLLLGALALPVGRSLAVDAAPETLPEVTRRVFFDVGVCSNNVRSDRALGAGSSGALCESPAPLGRIVIGLYGRTVPASADAFAALCLQGYKRTVFGRILPGEFIQAGATGSARLGGVELPANFPASNPDAVTPAAFTLRHLRPGTVSLALGADEGEDVPAGSPLTRFRITTGPGPVPRLDGSSIVIGRVLEGLDVVQAVSRVPTYAPLPSAKAWNALAGALGDGRAATARGAWSKPMQAVIITDCGELPA